MNSLSIADVNVETAGDPKVACQKLTKSAAESKRMAADAVSPPMFVMDKVLKSTIHNPVRTSRLP